MAIWHGQLDDLIFIQCQSVEGKEPTSSIPGTCCEWSDRLRNVGVLPVWAPFYRNPIVGQLDTDNASHLCIFLKKENHLQGIELYTHFYIFAELFGFSLCLLQEQEARYDGVQVNKGSLYSLSII